MIQVSDVVYDYPAARALHGVGFTLELGAVMALVGPNGAGKSTLMRCIAALDAPMGGTITVAGMDTQAEPRGVHAALGYLPDFFGLYDELSVRRSLLYAARSRGVAAARAGAAAEAAAERVGLSDRMEKRAGELSRGLRQRLAIGQSIVHGPRALLLDEPAAGLDPEARRSLSDLITALAGEGMTILVSSHILAELEDYATEMLMLKDGRVAGDGVVKLGTAHAKDGGARIRVSFAGDPADLRGQLEALGLTVEAAGPGEATVVLAPGEEAETKALGRMIVAGLKVKAFEPARSSLEDAYLQEARRPSPQGGAGDGR